MAQPEGPSAGFALVAWARLLPAPLTAVRSWAYHLTFQVGPPRLQKGRECQSYRPRKVVVNLRCDRDGEHLARGLAWKACSANLGGNEDCRPHSTRRLAERPPRCSGLGEDSRTCVRLPPDWPFTMGWGRWRWGRGLGRSRRQEAGRAHSGSSAPAGSPVPLCRRPWGQQRRGKISSGRW